jgi:hypothetical protein
MPRRSRRRIGLKSPHEAGQSRQSPQGGGPAEKAGGLSHSNAEEVRLQALSHLLATALVTIPRASRVVALVACVQVADRDAGPSYDPEQPGLGAVPFA